MAKNIPMSANLGNFLVFATNNLNGSFWQIGCHTIWVSIAQDRTRMVIIHSANEWGNLTATYYWQLNLIMGSPQRFEQGISGSTNFHPGHHAPPDLEGIWRILDTYEIVKDMSFTEGDIIEPLAKVLGQIPARDRISEDVSVGNCRTLNVNVLDESNGKKLSITVRQREKVSTHTWNIQYDGVGSILSVSPPRPQTANFGTPMFPNVLEQIQLADALKRLR